MALLPRSPENKVQYLAQRLGQDCPAGAKLGVCLDPEDHLAGNDLIAPRSFKKCLCGMTCPAK